MKNVIKILASLSLVLFVSASMNAQTATTVADQKIEKKCDITKCDPAKCDIKKCDPAMCDAMVKAGLCTKEEAAKCKAVCAAKSGTKVAAASVELVDGVAVTASSAQPAKKASCAKTCEKVCTGKKKGKTE